MSIEAALTCCCAGNPCCVNTSVLWSAIGTPTIQFPAGGAYQTLNINTPTSVVLQPSIYANQTLTRYIGPSNRCSYRNIGLQTVGNPVLGGSNGQDRIWVTFNGVSRPTAAYRPIWFAQAVLVTFGANGPPAFQFWEAGLVLQLFYGTGFPATYIQHGSITLGRTASIPTNGCPTNLAYRSGSPTAIYPWYGMITSGGTLPINNNAPFHDVNPATVEYASEPPSSFQVSIT